MQIFEFLFNPSPRRSPPPFVRKLGGGGGRARKKKIKQSASFDSFIFEPENIDEKKLGYLCMVGQLFNPLPTQVSSKFGQARPKTSLLDSLAQLIKSSYYSFPIKPTPEKALQQSLKKANEFLSEMAHKGDVSWLGNLHLTILTLGLNSPTNSIELNFTKAGDHKLFLLREGQIIDISHDIELQNIEPYPPKAFGNIVSGQLNRGDRLLVLSKEVFSVFNQFFKKTKETPHRFSQKSGGGQNLLSHLAKVSDFNEKSIKKILKAREKELFEISGICLAIDLSEKSLSEKLKLPLIVKKQKNGKPFKALVSEKLNNFKKAVSSRLSSVRLFSKTRLLFNRLFPQLSTKLSKLSLVGTYVPTRDKKKKKKEGRNQKPAQKPGKKPSKVFNLLGSLNPLRIIKPLTHKLSDFISSQKWLGLMIKKKNLILICGFILVLAIGFLLIGKQTQKQKQEIQEALAEAQIKINRAQSALIIKDENLANKFLLEAWEMVSPLAEEKKKNKELADIKEKIESELKKLNKLEEIKEPDLFAELNTDFNPERFVSIGNNFYFYAPGSNKVYVYSAPAAAGGGGAGQIFEAPQNIKFAVPFDFSLALFLENNNLVSLSGNQWSSESNLDKPFPNFTCDAFAVYNSNLYCLNKEKEQIIKYNHFTGLLWGSAQNWLKNNQEKIKQAKSMAIDGSVWVLNEGNSVDRYHLGEYQESIDINIFPLAENISAIKTTPALPYLYLLEPSQNRIIVLTKEGKIYKQIFSEKFDNLKDFEVSADAKTLWLLNGTKLFQISIDKI